MEQDTTTIDRVPEGGAHSHERRTTVPASENAAAASTLASSLRRRPGHVVVTAPYSTTAARIFAMAEPRLGTSRIIRLSARLLLEPEVARAIVGVTQRGLPPPSAAAVARVVEEAHRENRTIVILVEDGDAVRIDRLERIREMLAATPALREVVRIVLVGSGQLLRTIETPEAQPFSDALALHLNVSSPAPMTVAPAARRDSARGRRMAREPSWLGNEKLLVLAVGAVLVAGVLLFPIEPPVYPPAARVDVRENQAGDAASPAAPAATVDHTDVEAPVIEEAPAPEVSVPVAAATAAPAETPLDTPLETGPRFRPPTKPGPAFQVGAFRDRTNAVHLAERLAGDFEGVYIDQVGQGDASLHRVRVPIPGTVLGETTIARALAEQGFAPVRIE